MTAGTLYYSILVLLCALALGITEGAGLASWNNQACTPALCSLPAPGARVTHLQAVLESRRFS